MNFLHQEDWFNGRPGYTTKAPLAERMRPSELQAMVGQAHLVAPESTFVKWLDQGGGGNVILYGPPGCGKTTLARLIAGKLNKQLISINAVLSNLSELKEALKRTQQSLGKSLLFIDEIHRFNRSQQDALLPFCESGGIQLIGATTRHPAFYLIPALLSRSYFFELKPLDPEAIREVLERAVKDHEVGLGALALEIDSTTLERIARASSGDLRRALNLLEYLALSVPIGSRLSLDWVESQLKDWHTNYNARESDHFNCISAYIKSIRGCDPDAALYWLARMLKGGEDPLYVARRLIILASEDVGLADSRGLNLAASAYTACEKIGMPECGIPLAHVTLFLTLAPKSNSAYSAWNKACKLIDKGALQEVPEYLQEKPLSKTESYLYSHDFDANVSGQAYWQEVEHFYTPKLIGAEKSLVDYQTYRNQLRKHLRGTKT